MPVAQVLEQRLARRVSRPFLDPELAGDRPRDESRVGDAAELDEHRVCRLPIETAVTSSARRVLPDPAAPVNVRSRTSSRRKRARISRSSRVRPTKDDERRSEARPGSASTVCPRVGGGEIERGILVENRALELPERERRLDAERLHERAPRIAIRRERVRLPSRAVESEHELGAEALPERVPADQQLELGDELGIARRGRDPPRSVPGAPRAEAPRAARSRAAPTARRRTRPEAALARAQSASRSSRLASTGAAARASPTSCSKRSRSNDPASARSSYAEETVRIRSRPSARRS